tara:strand:+ start:316 stop:597 length:282 start_codon:yes stop_codon:yes gene_type:complete
MSDQDELPRHFVATLRYSTDNYRTVYFCADIDPLLAASAAKDVRIEELEALVRDVYVPPGHEDGDCLASPDSRETWAEWLAEKERILGKEAEE